MNKREHFLVFTGKRLKCALPLSQVERVVRAVEITPVENHSKPMIGVINVSGEILPVFDFRGDATADAVALTDQLILTHTSSRRLALLVASVDGLTELPADEISAAASASEGIKTIKGVAKLADGLVLIPDLDAVVTKPDSLHEEALVSN